MITEQIVGHRKQLLQLTQDLTQKNLTHAYLFAGPRFVGKTMVAKWFAGELLTEGMPPADREETFRQMDRLIHPDFLVLDQLWMEGRNEDWDELAQSSNIPQQHRAKAGLKTDVISIDDVREIQDRLIETGTLPRRVCLIRGVDRMQDAAANAFLKMLEEPPPGRFFLLTTESRANVLPTILSRTRLVRFDRVGNREVQTLLKGQPEEDVSFILHVAQGAPGVARRLAQDPDRLRLEKIAHTQAAAFWGASGLLQRIKCLAPLLERGEEADRFLFHLALGLRERPDYRPAQEHLLRELLRDLATNAYRPLVVQRFAMSAG